VPRPFYRSRLFWLGLPGLVFLLWTWWDSGQHFSGVTWQRPSETIEINVAAGRLCMVSYRDPDEGAGQLPAPVQYSVDRRVMITASLPEAGVRPRQFDTPRAIERLTGSAEDDPFGASYETRGIEVACWLLLLVYLFLWSTALLTWQRRKSRLLKLHAAPLP
jgi:hypothetical protein